MADDLVFPADDVSQLIGDFDILDDDVISPAFPQSDLLNIPQIVPPLINSAQRNYGPAMHNMNVSSPTVNSSYRPITQLMKQTQELASTLGSPLSSSLNQQLNYNNMINSTSLITQQNHALSNNILQQNHLVGNNMNYAPNTSKNSQFVVVGGQRVSMQQHASPQQLQSTGSPLHSQVPQIVDISSSSSGLQSGMNSVKPMQQLINTNNQQKQGLLLKMPQHQQSPQLTQQALVQQQKTVALPQSQPPQQIIPPENQVTAQKSAPLKGSIIKTSNQQLMFVTEVNGKKVGYVIQHPKPSTTLPSSPNPDNINVTVTTMSHPQSIQVTTQAVPSLDSIKPTIQKEKEPKQTDIKLLRERLQGLRNNNMNIKQQVNLKSQLPAMDKSDKVPPPPNSHYIELSLIHI